MTTCADRCGPSRGRDGTNALDGRTLLFGSNLSAGRRIFSSEDIGEGLPIICRDVPDPQGGLDSRIPDASFWRNWHCSAQAEEVIR
jgi:hypothetical protein